MVTEIMVKLSLKIPKLFSKKSTLFSITKTTPNHITNQDYAANLFIIHKILNEIFFILFYYFIK